MNDSAYGAANLTQHSIEDCPFGSEADSLEACLEWRAVNAAENAAVASQYANWINGVGAVFLFLSVVILVLTLLITNRQLKIVKQDRDDARKDASRLAKTTASALAQARRSSDAALETLEEASKANNLSREQHERSLRPYVCVSKAWFKIDDDIQPIAYVELKNYGQSPALEVGTWYQIWIEDFPLANRLPRPTEGEVHMSRGPLGTGGTTEIRHPRGNPLNAYSQSEILAGNAALYIYGESTYQDVFGNDYVSEFTLFATGEDQIKLRRFSHYSSGNSVRLVRP